jgi:hypothetical protein
MRRQEPKWAWLLLIPLPLPKGTLLAQMPITRASVEADSGDKHSLHLRLDRGNGPKREILTQVPRRSDRTARHALR